MIRGYFFFFGTVGHWGTGNGMGKEKSFIITVRIFLLSS